MSCPVDDKMQELWKWLTDWADELNDNRNVAGVTVRRVRQAADAIDALARDAGRYKLALERIQSVEFITTREDMVRALNEIGDITVDALMEPRDAALAPAKGEKDGDL